MTTNAADIDSSAVHGMCAPGYERVAEAFAGTLAEGRELGAAFAVARDGELVVDLWGGIADRTSGRAWQADTLAPIFSGTKALVAVCLLLLMDRGQLELDAPAARYWPEFGKPRVRVREIVSHTARLPGIDAAVSLHDVLDERRMAALLAEQQPSEDPRAARCYHALTFGWLCGELVRRVDGRALGRFFAEEIAGPLGLELWIGLPAEQESRVATLELADSWPTVPYLEPDRLARDPFLRSIWANPPLLLREGFPWNRRDVHAAGIPGGGAIGTVRSIAQLFARSRELLRPETLALACTTLSEGRFETVDRQWRYGVGFQLSTDEQPFGPVTDAFGHPGAGGSVHGCWPAHGIGFSYAMNLLRDDEDEDARAARLLGALHEAVA